MCRAPRIVDRVLLLLPLLLLLLRPLALPLHHLLAREIMKEPRLTRPTPLDHPLQIPRLVPLDLLLRVPVTGARHQHGRVDDQPDQILTARAEPRDLRLLGPHARRRVFVKAREFLPVGFQLCVVVFVCVLVLLVSSILFVFVIKGAVDVVAPFPVIDDARAETLLAVRPAHEVFGRGVGEALECGRREGGEA